MDIATEQHQVTVAFTAVEDRLIELNARLAQQVEDLTDTSRRTPAAVPVGR